MSTGSYLLGVLLAGITVGSLAVAGLLTRRMVLPAQSGAPARLAEGVIGIAALVLAAEALGTAGWFERGPLAALCAALALAAVLARRRRVAGAGLDVRGGEDVTAPSPGRAPTAVAIVVVALALVPWIDHTLGALSGGIREYDSVAYHMPFAARFAEQASVTGLQYVGNAPNSFYPANSELIHAVGIVLFGRDLLSPLINLAWLGLALLAGWCIGRPRGVGPATMAATALVSTTTVMANSQPGQAKNDIVALALLLAAVALLANARGSRAALALAALAGGLAVGTRLNLWVPALALGAVAVARESRGRRLGAAGLWASGLLAGGAFWYGRNLFATGNPLPWLGVRIDGLLHLRATSAPTDCGRTSVAHYLTDPGFVKAHLVPGLAESFGERWWLLLGLAAAGVVAGLLPRAAPPTRALAAVAAVSAVAYVLTPATAGGANAHCFAFNTRFAIPAIALGAILLPLVLAARGVSPLVAPAALLLMLVVDIHIPFAPKAALIALALVAVTTVAALGAWRRLPRPALAALLVALGLGALAGGWRVQRAYLRDRYQHPVLAEPTDSIYASVLGRVHGRRVAVMGFNETYPLYGRDVSNRVDLPAARVHGTRFAAYSTCVSWLRALQRGRYDYVVTGREGGGAAQAAGWTRRYPGGREVAASPPGYERRGIPWGWEVFRLSRGPAVDPRGACAGPRSPTR